MPTNCLIKDLVFLKEEVSVLAAFELKVLGANKKRTSYKIKLPENLFHFFY